MRILILNWRCPRNPKAGGAEVVTHEVARRMVADGNHVEWFCSSFPGAPPTELIDGVQFIRAGRQWSVHWAAFRRYHGKLKGRFDAVIDETNTIPFLTPLWAGIPAFLFIHQLAREVWWYESPFPFSLFGYLLEPLYLRLYHRTPVLTVSESTAQDLRRLALSGPITILREGLEPIVVEALENKSTTPTFLYVGRIAPSKRIDHIVKAFAEFRREVGPAVLWLIGAGPPQYRQALLKLIAAYRLEGEVLFLGYLPREIKQQRMAQAHALLMTSVREGWGLVVLEANACGTPAIVYGVPGLRDSVIHEGTGLIVSPNPSALAAGMVRLWRDDRFRKNLAGAAQHWSASFSFEKMAADFEQSIAMSAGGGAAVKAS